MQTDPAHRFLHVRKEAPQREDIYLDRVDVAVPHGTGAGHYSVGKCKIVVFITLGDPSGWTR